MIRFKDGTSGRLNLEWANLLHPDTRTLLMAFDRFSQGEGLPDTVITQIMRTKAEQQAIYFDIFKRQVELLQTNEKALNLDERQQAIEMRGKTDDELRELASGRFSWHLIGCAADLRANHYNPEQLVIAKRFFSKTAPRPIWEFLLHKGTALHLHVARRDFGLRKSRSPVA